MNINSKKIQKMLFILCMQAFSLSAIAQNAQEQSVEFNKQSQPGFVATYTFQKNVLEDFLAEKIKRATSAKARKSNGFVKYEGVLFPEISSNKVDIYTKVDGKKTIPVITMLVSSGYDNFIGNAKDAQVANNSIAFLNKLDAELKHVLEIQTQEKILLEAQDKLKASEKEKEKLQREKDNIEKKLAQEEKALEIANQKVETEKAKLDQIKTIDMVVPAN